MAVLLGAAAAATDPAVFPSLAPSTAAPASAPPPTTAVSTSATDPPPQPSTSAPSPLLSGLPAVTEPWHVVHAFNCLKHAFNDAQLTADTSGSVAPAIEVRLNTLLHCQGPTMDATGTAATRTCHLQQPAAAVTLSCPLPPTPANATP
jgi:hypothetical protein